MLNKHLITTLNDAAILQQILPFPSTEVVENRFSSISSEAPCKPGGCSGECAGRFA